MGIITEITKQKGGRKRVNLFIDGSFFCGLDELTALKNRLKVGDEVDEDDIARLQKESEYATALDKSLGYLSVRPRSGKEIRDYLKGKGYLTETADKVCDRLKELSYLDDYAYAKQYVDENMSRYGAVRLKNELIKRGVARDTVQEVIDEADRSEAVTTLARSLWRSCGGDKFKLRNKLYAKGCGSDDISEAMQALDDEGLFDEE